MSQNSIDDAIAKAKQSAGNLASNLPTIDMAPQPGVPDTYAPARPATVESFLEQSSFKVDKWMGASNMGFTVKGHDMAIDDMPLLGFNASQDLAPFWGIRMNIGGKATYYKTTDRVTCSKSGRPWSQLIAEAAQAGVREYKGFDVRFTVLSPIKDLKGKPVAVEPGSRLGFSTAITNFDDVAEFARKLQHAGLFNADLKVQIKCEVRKNDKNPSGWGALTFANFELAES